MRFARLDAAVEAKQDALRSFSEAGLFEQANYSSTESTISESRDWGFVIPVLCVPFSDIVKAGSAGLHDRLIHKTLNLIALIHLGK